MRTFKFIIQKNLLTQLASKEKFGISLANAFVIKSDILNSSFLYECQSHDTIPETKKNLEELFLREFGVTKLDFKISESALAQHNILIWEPEIKIEIKKQKK